MRILMLVIGMILLPNMVMGGEIQTDTDVSLNNFYGYTDYSKPYDKLYKQNNLNSSLNCIIKIIQHH